LSRGDNQRKRLIASGFADNLTPDFSPQSKATWNGAELDRVVKSSFDHPKSTSVIPSSIAIRTPHASKKELATPATTNAIAFGTG